MTRVLLLEDETMIQMLIEDYLNDLGYDTLPTSNLDDAIHAYENEAFDFALLDVNLGNGTTSYPLAERMLAAKKCFAFMSGYNSHTREGFDHVTKLSKPINFGLLESTLIELTERAANPE